MVDPEFKNIQDFRGFNGQTLQVMSEGISDDQPKGLVFTSGHPTLMV